MAREFIDGFEGKTTALWNEATGIVAAAAPGMTGGGCLYCLDDKYVVKTVTARNQYYIAFKYRKFNNSFGRLVRFRNGTNNLGSVVRNENSYVLDAVYSSSVVASTPGVVIALDTTYLVEVYYKSNSTTGRIVIKINGTTVIDYTGNTGSSNVDNIKFGDGNAYYDDIVIETANWIGDTRIQPIIVTGNGSSTQFSPSLLSNWNCVDEVPVSEDDFVYVSEKDKVDLYSGSNMVGQVDAIRCLQLQANCVRHGAPEPDKLQLALRTNAGNYFSGNLTLGVTATVAVAAYWEVNPNTGVAWTKYEYQ